MTLSPTALEAAAKAVEQDLSRDIAAWVERYTGPHGCDDDAPEPPKGNYRSTPTRLATAAITAYLAQAEKEGWVMVPKEPSEAMIEAGCDNNPTQWNEGTDLGFAADVANDVYRAMLSAALATAEQVAALRAKEQAANEIAAAIRAGRGEA